MLVREGLPIEGACRVAGVLRQTLGEWVRVGVGHVSAGLRTPEAQLAFALECALGDQERSLVKIVMSGAKADPQIALGVLAVRRPDHWAPAAPMPVDARATYQSMTEAELRQEVTRLLAAKNPEPEAK